MQQLLTFMELAEKDPKMGAVHINLYFVLFRLAHVSGENPVSFSRPAIMSASKISSSATYHKCIRDLHDFGYIKYIPSHHPVLGSLAFLQVMGDQETVSPKRK